ncbi:hypothetical protein BDF14DRAFT_1819420 [Spinellus fusiger]|nr:hypothetical protein BDF14DRAFT_1819420 [Spinellus fusiger]
MLKSVTIPILVLVFLTFVSAYREWKVEITEPKDGDLWKGGQNYTVKWKTNLTKKELMKASGELVIYKDYNDAFKTVDEQFGSVRQVKPVRKYQLSNKFLLSQGSIKVTAPKNVTWEYGVLYLRIEELNDRIIKSDGYSHVIVNP